MPTSRLGESHERRGLSGRPARRRRRRSPPVVERLESRTLLAVVAGAIPDSLLFTAADGTPIPIAQTLFAPGTTLLQTTVAAWDNGKIAASYYRFSTDSAAGSGAIEVTTGLAGNVVDVGLALFDQAGNLLAKVDADLLAGVAGPGRERLVAALDPSTPYVLGVYTRNLSPGASMLPVTVTTAGQHPSSTVSVAAGTGKGTFVATGDDRLLAPADVRYFPIDLTNVAATETVQIGPDPTLADTRLFGTVFTRAAADQPWSAIGSGNGAGFSFKLTAAAGGNLTDRDYLLAVSTQQFASAVQGFRITLAPTVASQAPVVPASVNAPGLDGGFLLPSTPGTATLTRTIAQPAGAFTTLRASVDGPLRLLVTPAGGYDQGGMALAVYDAVTKALLSVDSRTEPGPIATTIVATKGRAYTVLALQLKKGPGGSALLTATQDYQPAGDDVILAVNKLGAVTDLPLDPSVGGRIVRIVPSPSAGILVLNLKADAGAKGTPRLWIARAGGTTFESTSADTCLDLAKVSGPFDLFISGTGAGTATLRIRAADIAPALPAAAFTTAASLDLAQGGLSKTFPGQTFGSVTGSALRFFDPTPGMEETIRASSTGPVAVMAYVRQGNAFVLASWSLSTDPKQAATITRFVPGRTVVGVTAMSLAVDGPRDLAVSVGSVAPKPPVPREGVGVAMVPNVDDPRQALLQIRKVALETAEQRDLWQTTLPANLVKSGAQTLVFEPATPDQPLAARVSVLDGKNTVLLSQTSQPGQPLTMSLGSLFPKKGSTLSPGGLIRFLVEPIGADIGDGLYTLQLTSATGNSLPFLVTEQTFLPPRSEPASSVLPAIPPSGEPVETLSQGAFPKALAITPVKITALSMQGSAGGKFTNALPYYAPVTKGSDGNPGAINVFRFTIPQGIADKDVPAFEISTVAAPGSSVNTNIGLYVANYHGGGPLPTSYDQVPDVAPSFDYDPAGRKVVDAKIVVSNPAAVGAGLFSGDHKTPDGSRTFYVVVKNEQGTVGDYTLSIKPTKPVHVGPWVAPSPLQVAAADRTVALDPLTGTSLDRTTNKTVISLSGSAAAFRLALPSTVVSGASILLTVGVGKTGVRKASESIQVTVGDADGTPLSTRSFLLGQQTSILASLDDDAHPFLPGHAYVIGLKTAPTSPLLSLSATGQIDPLAGVPGPGVVDTLGKVSFPSGKSLQIPVPYQILVAAPDGTSHSSLKAPGAVAPGTHDKSLFFVEHAGPATFTLHAGGLGKGTVALYRVGRNAAVQEFGQDVFSGTIVDAAAVLPGGGDVSFTDYVTPGCYYLQEVGEGSEQSASWDIALPAFDAIDLPLNPDDGDNTPAPRQTKDPVASFLGGSYHRVVALPGTLGTWQINLPWTDADPTLRTGVLDDAFAVYRRKPLGGFERVSIATTVENGVRVIKPSGGDEASPDDEYYLGHVVAIGADRVRLAPKFVVPHSGDPDLKTDVTLLAGGGFTRARIVIRNVGFAGSSDCESTLQVSNYATPTATHLLAAIGAQGSLDESFVWNPDATTDLVGYVANANHAFKERTEANNDDEVVLAAVDAAAPTVTIGLDDPALTGEADPGVWGRYIAGVAGPILGVRVRGVDPSNDLWRVTSSRTVGFYAHDDHASTIPGETLGFGTQDVAFQVDAGAIAPTSPDDPNEISYEAIDQFGLRSGEFVQRIDVVKTPTVWSKNYDENGEPFHVYDAQGQYVERPKTLIAWNPTTKRYDLAIDYDVSHYQETVAQALGANVPFIGDKLNRFIVNLSGSGSASLDPNAPIDVPIAVHLALEAVGQTIFDETYAGKQQINDNLSVEVAPIIESRSVDIIGGSVSLQLRDKNLFDKTFPKIPVYSIGIPGVASFSIDIRFGISADLDAGVKVGVLLNPLDVGLMIPTFVSPSVTPRAEISGDVQFLGFDLGSVAGQFKLEIKVTAGMTDKVPGHPNYQEVVPFGDFFSRLGVGAEIIPKLAAKATVLECTVWNSGDLVLADYKIGADITTTDLGAAKGPPPAQPDKVYRIADATFDRANVEAAPQLLVDRATQDAMMVFETPVPVDPADPAQGTRSNLRVLRRQGGLWSASDLPGGDVSHPALGLTRDPGVQAGAVVVYEKLVGYPSRNQAGNFRSIITHTELASRTFDGTSWSAETNLTPVDGRFDMQPAVAFNDAGAGIATWMHGSSADPFTADGATFLRNTQDIQAAVWLPATHGWSAPVTLSPAGDTQSDTKPAAFVDAAGNATVVWVRGETGASQLWFARYDAVTKKWSAAANLPISGLPAGTIDGVAIGADKAGRIDTVFSFRGKGADGLDHSGLYNRPAPSPSFSQTAGVEAISTVSANFMHLRTTNAPDGSLVASWQQNTGADDGVYESTLPRISGATAGLPWTKPVKLTSSAGASRQPAVAVEADGTLQVVAASVAFPELKDEPPLSAATGKTISGIDGLLGGGIATSSFARLPELTFAAPLSFGGAQTAVAGREATGRATIANVGLADDVVTVRWYGGAGTTTAGPQLVGTRTVTIPAGGRYELEAPFPVRMGANTFTVTVTGTKDEAITTLDDSSTASIVGKIDLAARSLAFASLPQPGKAQTLTATVANPSGLPVGPFRVALYAGDPNQPHTAPTLLQGPVEIVGLDAGASRTIDFPGVVLPESAGRYVYTVVVDPERTLDEVTRSNDSATAEGVFRGDPAIGFDAAGRALVEARLLDAGGVDNVAVDAWVVNRGQVVLRDVVVDLHASRDGQPPLLAGTRTIPVIQPGQSVPVSFVTSGLDGLNRYRVSIDPASAVGDDNLSNDTGTTRLVIHGMADLTAGPIQLGSTTLQQGKPLTLTTSIGNRGIADARAALVEVFAVAVVPPNHVGPVARQRIASTFVDVAALGTKEVTLALDTSRLMGRYNLVVRVNRFHSVLESDETNDSSTLADQTFLP